MQRGELLALIGIALALLFGIPSLTVILVDRSAAVPIFFILLALLFLIPALFLLWLWRSSPWTIIRHESTVTLEDIEGRRATFEKRLIMRSNRFRQNSYRHRDISVDGTLAEAEFETEGAKVVSSGKEAGDYYVEVTFPRSVGLLARVETSLRLPLQNCFMDNEESVTLTANLPIKNARVEVVFPSGRLPIHCQASYEDAGRSREITAGLRQGHRSLYWDCPSGILGLRRGDYTLRWSW